MYTEGNPIGFQRCVKADNTRGITSSVVNLQNMLVEIRLSFRAEYHSSYSKYYRALNINDESSELSILGTLITDPHNIIITIIDMITIITFPIMT